MFGLRLDFKTRNKGFDSGLWLVGLGVCGFGGWGWCWKGGGVVRFVIVIIFFDNDTIMYCLSTSYESWNCQNSLGGGGVLMRI